MDAHHGALSAVSTDSSMELSGHSDLDDDGVQQRSRNREESNGNTNTLELASPNFVDLFTADSPKDPMGGDDGTASGHQRMDSEVIHPKSCPSPKSPESPQSPPAEV